MAHYSENEAAVRVDFFKLNGKWYTTEAIDMDSLCRNEVTDIWARRLKDIIQIHLKGRLKGMWAVCLEPYHPMGFPMMIKLDD